MFAKIFETEEQGQILVKKDQTEGGCAEVRFFFEPESLGVCSVAVNFDDTDAGWASADNIFSEITEKMAVNMVAETKTKAGIQG